MTQNQIAYQQLLETKRHNLEQENIGKMQQGSNIATVAMNPISRPISTGISTLLKGSLNGKRN